MRKYLTGFITGMLMAFALGACASSEGSGSDTSSPAPKSTVLLTAADDDVVALQSEVDDLASQVDELASEMEAMQGVRSRTEELESYTEELGSEMTSLDMRLDGAEGDIDEVCRWLGFNTDFFGC